jgi:hypothetical protein
LAFVVGARDEKCGRGASITIRQSYTISDTRKSHQEDAERNGALAHSPVASQNGGYTT